MKNLNSSEATNKSKHADLVKLSPFLFQKTANFTNPVFEALSFKDMSKPFYIYVDVDETFVRNYGEKRIPMPSVLDHIKALKEQGATLYCWSSGGAQYAEESAKEFGIENCFVGFLPKPEVAIDDMGFSQWRNLLQVHPNECPDNTIESYKEKIIEQQTKT